MTQAQPKSRDIVKHPQTFRLLIDNIDLLVHPAGPIPHPYFNDPLRTAGAGLAEIRKIYCEGITLLLENDDRLNDRPSPSRAVVNKNPQDERTVQLIADNLAELQHPKMVIKNPYFQTRFSPDPDGIRKLAVLYAEAIVLLLENNDHLKKRAGRPRKDAD